MSLSGKAAVGLVASAAIVALGSGIANAAQDYYGSLALGITSNAIIVGSGTNYPDQEGADVRAMRECGVSNCQIIVQFRNACGAVAVRGDEVAWAGGYTRVEAEQAAMANLGPDPSPLLVSLGSASPARGHIMASECAG
ncbi:DUF4189 domain-containing protein [Nocardia arizonensis]|uniref:DUF4189 domain-containing protein n=1 Tax=Nocardia arizonensis TaxID=1141647 RepID=UPI0006CFEE03|nr:DUF4189 domain-containing protein [Nocardia arizonensis]